MKKLFQLNRFMVTLCAMLTMSLTSAWAVTSPYVATPSGTISAKGGSITLNEVSWSYGSATYLAISNSLFQIGSKNNPQTTGWTISTPISSFGSSVTITKVKIAAKTGGAGSFDISVGGASVLSDALTTTLTDYETSTLSVSSGSIDITITGETKAAYLGTITVTFSKGGSDPELTVSPEAIKFDNVLVGTASVAGKEVAVKMENIEEVLVGFSTNSPFKVDKESLTASDTVIVTPADSILTIVGEHIDTLLVTDADKLTKKVPVSIKVIEPAKVNSVAFTKESVQVMVGKTLKLAYTIAPEDAIDQRVSFKSLDEDALTVAEDGTITGVAINASVPVVITALDSLNKGDKLTDTCWVEVKAVPKYASIFTSNISTSLNDTVIIGGTKYGAVKTGTSSKAGSTTIEIPAYTSTLHFHAAAWNKETVKIQLVSGTDTLGAFDLVADAGVANNSPYTLQNDPVDNDYFALEIGNEESMEITVSAILGKRFVLFGINAEEQKGGDSVLVNSIAFAEDSARVEVGESLKLKYTIAPNNATDKRVNFKSLNEDALTVAEDGTITGVAANASVAVVITALDSLNKGDKLTDTCFVTVVAIVFNTCADVNAAAKDDVLKLNPVTVSYVNGSNIYVQDATGSTLVYMFGSGLKAGDVVSGIKGKAAPYNGLPELKPTNKPADWTITAGEAPAFPDATSAPAADQVNTIFTYKGVTELDGSFVEGTISELTGKFLGEDFKLYSNFKQAATFDKAKIYDVVGAVGIINNTDVRVFFISATEVTPTHINEVAEKAAVKKMIVNGQVVFLKDGKMFNALGVEL